MLEIKLLKIPSFKVKNKASVVYPYQTRAPCTTPIPASLNDQFLFTKGAVCFAFNCSSDTKNRFLHKTIVKYV